MSLGQILIFEFWGGPLNCGGRVVQGGATLVEVRRAAGLSQTQLHTTLLDKLREKQVILIGFVSAPPDDPPLRDKAAASRPKPQAKAKTAPSYTVQDMVGRMWDNLQSEGNDPEDVAERQRQKKAKKRETNKKPPQGGFKL